MTRLQKVVIVILGLLNVVVIVVLGNIVVWNMLQPRAFEDLSGDNGTLVNSSPSFDFVDYCPNAVIASLPLSLHPVVDWGTQQHLGVQELTIALHEVYTTSIPPASSAQYLWTAVDAVAAALRAGCAPPYTVTLVMSAQGRLGPDGIAETHHHIVKLKGQDIMAWTIGTLPNEALASQAAYRQTNSITPDKNDSPLDDFDSHLP